MMVLEVRNRIISIAVSVILLDQASKYLARLQGWIVPNYGISFAVLTLSPWVLIGLSLLILFAFGWWGRSLWQSYPFAAGLVAGGALSNSIDRVLFGYVHDWMAVPLVDITNNLADWAVVLGIGYILIRELEIEL